MLSTSIEQSKHLLELGLDPITADMVYLFEDKEYPCVLKEPDYLDGSDTLAWSLSALLEVMPKPDLYRETADLWVCVTFFKEGSIRGFGETAIEAAYKMVCWLLEQGLIEKGNNNE